MTLVRAVIGLTLHTKWVGGTSMTYFHGTDPVLISRTNPLGFKQLVPGYQGPITDAKNSIHVNRQRWHYIVECHRETGHLTWEMRWYIILHDLDWSMRKMGYLIDRFPGRVRHDLKWWWYARTH
jgi:hypothetical protein